VGGWYTLSDKFSLTSGTSGVYVSPNPANSLTGTPYDDVLIGSSENDVIVGGAGQDILTGNGGNDVFTYQAASDAGNTGDTITDFTSGDQLSVKALLNSVAYTGSNPLSDGYLGFSHSGNNTLVSFDPDGTAGLAPSTNLVTLQNFQGSLSYNSVLGALV
jgi:Ca2+-binding RTX toxin-like protein